MIDGPRVMLTLDGEEATVRRAVDAFFEEFDPYAFDARMERAWYSKTGGLRVILSRLLDVKPQYRRDFI